MVTGTPSSFIEEKIVGLMNLGWEVILLTPHKNDYEKISNLRISKTELRKKKKNFFVLIKALMHIRWFFKVSKFFKTVEPNSTFDGIKMALELIYLSQEKKPQLIHVQWLYDTYRFFPLAEKWEIPLLVSIRGSQANYQIDTTVDGTKNFQFNAQLATHFHVVGKELAKKLENLAIPKEKITHIYNGINRSVFQALPNPSMAKSPIKIITVGNFHPRKNHLGALSLMTELNQTGIDFEWTFIGEGPDLKKFQYFVNRLNLPPNSVKFFEKKSPKEMAIEYQNNHFFLGFSISEGLCNSVLEAMSCGCVPLVFQSTGMEELILHAQNGYIVPWGDVMEMKDLLLSFLPLGEKWQIMRENTIAASKNFPKVEDANQNWNIWYQKILEGKE
jgi:glycosyltransferase involved in cell wall biosynthesis